MFSIDSRDHVEPKVDMMSMREWAGEIASSYLASGVAPTHTLCKIAQAEDLTPHQVEVLAAEANKTIHSHKYANMAEKYHAADFPLADAKIALAQLQLDGGETKVAADLSEPERFDTGPDPFQMFGIKPEVMDKTASVKHQLKVAAEKSASLLSKLEDKIIITQNVKTAEEHKFIKQARQAMLEEGNSLDRLKVLGAFDHLVKQAELPNARKTLAKLATLMMQEGKIEPGVGRRCVNYFMSKEADCKAPEELISPNLQARVVNGSHPLYITLQTIHKHEADLLRFEQDRDLVQDKVRIVSQKIRAL